MATEQQLKQALIQAHNAGDKEAANLFASRIKSMQAQPVQPGQSDLPTESNLQADQQRAMAQQQPEASIGDKVIGALETGASLVTGATGGLIGGLAGGLAGATGELTGNIEEGEGERLLQEGASALTYQPRTEFGRELLGEIGELTGSLPAFAGGTPTIAAQAATAPTFRTLQLAGKAKGAGKRVLQNASKTRKAIAEEIKAGNINTENIVKTLDADGTLIPNPDLKDAIRLMGGEDAAKNTAVNFSYMNNATKKQVNKILDSISDTKKSGQAEDVLVNRPANVIGESLANRFIALDKIKKNASKQIGNLINGDLGNKKADVSTARNQFVQALNDADISVVVNEVGDLVADTGRTLTNIDEVVSQKKLNNILGRLQAGNISAREAHKLKRNIREMVSYDAANVGAVKVSKEIENAFKALSNELGDSISVIDSRYQRANQKFADSVGDLQAVDKLLGNQLMIGDDLAVNKLGALAKRIGSNLQSRDNVIKVVEGVDESLNKQGIRPKDNIYQQVMALSDLEKIFKVESEQSPFGFQSMVAQGAAEALQGRGSLQDRAIEAALSKFRGMSELEFNDKMKALRRLSKTKNQN